MLHRALWVLPLVLAGCGGPELAGQKVGQSLYDASVSTGRALAIAGDRTGHALQNAGTGLRNAVNPPVADPAPVALPPPYVPDGYDSPAPVTATPLAPGY